MAKERVLELEDLRKIDLVLEDFYPKSMEIASQMVDLDTSQIRKLETLVVSTRRFSEIVNFIKNQAGKRNEISRKWAAVAPQILDQLEKLQEKARTVEGKDPEKNLEIKLRLSRGWVKQLVAHYLYAGSLRP